MNRKQFGIIISLLIMGCAYESYKYHIEYITTGNQSALKGCIIYILLILGITFKAIHKLNNDETEKHNNTKIEKIPKRKHKLFKTKPKKLKHKDHTNEYIDHIWNEIK